MSIVPSTYLAVGPNCWGKGLSVGQALREARKHLPTWNRHQGARFSVYRVDPAAYVDEMGFIVAPKNGVQSEFIKAVPVAINGKQ